MNPYNMSVQEETVVYENRLVSFYRGIITAMDHQVMDKTKLYDTYDAASNAAEVLLKLYEEKARERIVVVGYISHETMEQMESGNWESGPIFRQPLRHSVIPVYAKLNDHFATHPPRT